MVEIRGFATIKSLVDNARGVVATLGEISQESLSFSRDVTFYNHDTNKLFTYVNLHRVDGNNTNIVISPENQQTILEFLDWIAIAGKDGTITSDRQTFINNWVQKFPDMADEYISGEMRTEGEYYLPERVQWHKHEDIFEIFFADDIMETYWQPWAIEVVPPLANIDELLQSINDVVPILNGRSLTTTLELMNTVKREYPYTYNENEVLEWHQYNNSNITTPTNWVLLQYGPNAKDPENIRNALREWIIAHSLKDETEWYPVFPELFIPILFYITPLWDNLAIPSQSTTSGVYSPVIDYVRDIKKIKVFSPFNEDHVALITEFFPSRFSCLTLAMVGSDANKVGSERVSLIHPTYLSVSVGSPDFVRQDPVTQEWSAAIIELIRTAETYEPNDWVPENVVPIVKDGIVYLSLKIGSDNFLVVTKQSYLDTLEKEGSEIGDSNNPE